MKHKNIAYINMTALENNYRAIEKIVSENAEKKPRIIAVVKADAYGHGIENVAKALGDAGCDMYAVSSEEEAVELREVEEKNGRMPDILILSRISPENVADMIEKNITAAVTSYDNALALNDAAAEAGGKLKIHVKLDTGMNRVGFSAREDDADDTAAKIEELSKCEGLELCGIFTHFSAASVAWYNFYGRPADGMTKIAVTGTAGKTSVAFILRELLLSSGRRVGVVTTIRAMSGTRTLELGENGGSSVNGVSGAMTTPDPEYFWYAAAEMKKDGCDTVIYEASSQSLLRKAVSVVTPDLCIFTNLSEEHMDAHGTMENYFSTKAGLLEGVKNAVVNVDDEYFSRLPDMFRSCNFIRVSARRENAGKTEVCALRYHSMGENGTEYVYFSEKAVFRTYSRQYSPRRSKSREHHSRFHEGSL